MHFFGIPSPGSSENLLRITWNPPETQPGEAINWSQTLKVHMVGRSVKRWGVVWQFCNLLPDSSRKHSGKGCRRQCFLLQFYPIFGGYVKWIIRWWHFFRVSRLLVVTPLSPKKFLLWVLLVHIPDLRVVQEISLTPICLGNSFNVNYNFHLRVRTPSQKFSKVLVHFSANCLFIMTFGHCPLQVIKSSRKQRSTLCTAPRNWFVMAQISICGTAFLAVKLLCHRRGLSVLLEGC